jgi:hypothetical protein
MKKENSKADSKNKRVTKPTLFLELAKINKKTGKSKWISTEKFTGKYSSLQTTNGGDWCRFDTFKLANDYILVTVKKNGDMRISGELSTEKTKQLNTSLKKYTKKHKIELKKGNGTKIILMRFYGINPKKQINRTINPTIRKKVIQESCVHCGSSSIIECDHKNGRYNDPRVNDIKTQLETDFQPTCKHCNDLKRQHCKKCKETNIRFDGRKTKLGKAFNVSYTKGNKTYQDTCKGCYWYDCKVFDKFCSDKLIDIEDLSNNFTKELTI